MKTILAALALVLPALSFAADFTGHWLANDGKVSSNVGISGKCTKVEIVIEQTPDALVTKSYVAKCNLFDTDWGPIRQDVKNGKVYEGKEEVGTFDGTTLKTISKDGQYNYAYNLRIGQAADGTPTLQTYYGAQGGVGAMVVEATLKKQ